MMEQADDKPETDRDSVPTYYNPMTNPDIKPDASFFYGSRGGRFVFPFEEGEQKQLISLDECVESKLQPYAEKVEGLARYVWREVFTALRVGFIFIFIFVIELVRFVARDIVHGFVIRLLAIIGDFIIKPLLVTSFNNFALPVIVFIWNILAAVFSMCDPLIQLINALAKQIAIILGAFRLVAVNTGNTKTVQEV